MGGDVLWLQGQLNFQDQMLIAKFLFCVVTLPAVNSKSPCVTCVQCIEGYHQCIRRHVISALGDIITALGGYHQCIWEVSVLLWNIPNALMIFPHK